MTSYLTRNNPPLDLILSQLNPFNIFTSSLFKTHFNSIHPSTPRSPKSSLTLNFFDQISYYLFLMAWCLVKHRDNFNFTLTMRTAVSAHLVFLDHISVVIFTEKYQSWSSFGLALSSVVKTSKKYIEWWLILGTRLEGECVEIFVGRGERLVVVNICRSFSEPLNLIWRRYSHLSNIPWN
jgi:hypothetical protein